MLCVLCLIVLWGFSLVTSYSGVIDLDRTILNSSTHFQAHSPPHVAHAHHCAGIKNLKLDARMRIELSEPLPAAPYFAAVTLSFLEPLAPTFSLKLQTALLPEGLTRPIVEPILSNILKEKVFAVRRALKILRIFFYLTPEK